MRKYIDLDAERMTDALGVLSFTSLLEQKRALLGVLEIQFIRLGQVIELPNDATGRFQLKVRTEYDSPEAITGAAAWIKFGSGTDTYYLFAYGLINDAINALLGYDPPVAFTTTFGTNTFNAVEHGLVIGNRVAYGTTDTLPAPLIPGIHYFIKSVPDDDHYTVSATLDGDEVDLADNGTGTHTFAKVSNDITDATLMSEVSWKVSGRNYKAQTVDFKIINDVNREADIIPPSPAITYVRDSFIRVEDAPPDDSVGVDGDCWIYTVTGDLYQREGGVYLFEMNILGSGGSGSVANIMIDDTDPDDPEIMFGEDLEILTYG